MARKDCDTTQDHVFPNDGSLTIEGDGKKEVLSLRQSAAFLAISTRNLYRLVQQNEIPHRKIGKQYRFLKSELISWLKGDS